MKFTPSLIPRFNIDYGIDDVICSVRSIFGETDAELLSLRNIFGDGNFFFTNTGRTSLYVILKALNLPKGSIIGVPLYSCTVVFDAIIKAGYVPYFIDMDLDNYTLDPVDLAVKISDLSAVVVIHTFGRPAEMDRIKEIVGDVPIIEDCAHSLLSKYKGRQTGTLSFASFFSFKKYLSMGEGGMIVLNDDTFIKEFQIEINSLNSFTVMEEVKDAFLTYIYSSIYHKPWFGLFAYPMGSYLRSVLDRSDGVGDFKLNNIRKGEFSLLFKKLNKFEERMESQRKNSIYLIENLRDTSLILPHEKKGTYCNYYLFPIRFSNKKERDKACMLLRDMGVDTAKLYSETPLKAKKFYGYRENCPNSEIVADTILTIPNYYTLSKKCLIKITSSLKKMEMLL